VEEEEEEEEDAVSFGHGDVWEGGECLCLPVQPPAQGC
jgi:hypothetical protein